MKNKLNESRSKLMNILIGVLVVGIIVSVIVAIIEGNKHFLVVYNNDSYDSSEQFNFYVFFETLFLMLLPYICIYVSGIGIISYISEVKKELLDGMKILDTENLLDKKEKIVKCASCGKESKKGKFCEHCGEPLN